MKKLCVWAVAALLMAACTPKAEKATDSGLLQSKFQTEVDGKKTDLFTLRNKNNMEVCITNFGGRIVSVMVPDKDGQMRDVVLGFDSIQDYISKPSDFGATIGRYANRINQGHRNINKMLVNQVLPTCQLQMGMTELAPGSVWNTMPAHVHSRRMEAYFYFEIPEEHAICHFMGEVGETRHVWMKGDQAVLSPEWSIHSAAATHNYTFIWGMGGENLDYGDQDFSLITDLK